MKRIFNDRDAEQARKSDQFWTLALAGAVLYIPVGYLLLWYVWRA